MALAAFATLVACFGLSGTASASEKVADNATNVALRVDAKGHAVVDYSKAGRRWHVVYWGALNARPPSATRPQVKFRVDYSGGFKKLGSPLWKTMKNRCRPYDGPKLPWFVAACKAPDGSYWALQQFKRLLPNLGVDPWLPRHRARELQLSHWTGELPKLDVYADWVMSFRYHELFGRLTYRGKAVFGYKSSLSGEPLDTYGRLIFLDTYNSRLGAGWKRENSFLARRKGSPGHFCYMFVQRNRYGGYPAGPPGPPANGERYRLTSRGPGVTPVIMTVVDGLQDYDVDPDADRIEAAMNPLKTVVVGDDSGCFTN
jgi:hypothetical protein